ncbi:MAG: methionyl-tRNA formyltransferase [Nitrosomonas sp.]|nr:methionyl-tRNA formyltransferase [Nitrosomonas sp.]
MKIIFAGTPVFAATALDALISIGHEIVLVLTQPDRPAGRGMKLVASPVKQLAAQHGLVLLQPQSLRSQTLHEQLQAFNADVMVVAAYGLILPDIVLKIPRYGCLNIHASLLPRWRGAAPIQRAILAGDQNTGITIMQMDAGLDTGAMLLSHEVDIEQNDTTQSLHDKLSILGAQSIIEALALLSQGEFDPVVQDEALACYASKIKKNEAQIDWQQTAKQINRAIRAFNPSPGAFTYFQGKMIKLWRAQLVEGEASQPGEIMGIDRDGITVSCGMGLLRLEIIQKAGGKKLNAENFLAGHVMQIGEYFEAVKYIGSEA